MISFFKQTYKNAEEAFFEKSPSLADELLDIELEIESIRFFQSSIIDLMTHIHTANYIDHSVAEKLVALLSKNLCTHNDDIKNLVEQYEFKKKEATKHKPRF